jgi:hypothetical protein
MDAASTRLARCAVTTSANDLTPNVDAPQLHRARAG